MKKGLLITGGIILFLVAALAASPWLFKNKIKSKAENSLTESVNAQIVFDNFGLSVFKDFPNISVSVSDFSVVGKDVFQRDTLIAGKYAQVDLNLLSVLFGDQVKVNGIELESPKVLIKILEGGYANYDIAIETDSATEEDIADSQFSLEIDHWTITDGRFIYDDEAGKLLFHLDAFNHQGSGDFSQDIFDLSTNSKGLIKTLRSEGIDYLSDKQLDANITLEMDLPNSKYTFKQNTISLNDFGFSFDGWIAMPDEDIDMDINFVAEENDFQSLLSLAPGVYKEGFENIQSEGKVQFDGFAKGVYSESTIPGFAVNLKVDEAMFQYPDLPNAVENINVDMQVSNSDGVLDNTLINVKQMHMDFGQNPIDGKVLIKGLETSEVNADIKAKINLAELSTMFPMEGLSMKGLYDLKLIAKGTYDSASQQFPSVDADMILKNGFIKSKEFPTPLENINLVAS
ncbi:MAG: AsmA family protein, partial [Cyclobacteriaceae bacterium]